MLAPKHKQTSSGAEQTVQTVCGICNGICGMNVTLTKGSVARVDGQEENAFTSGYLCPKGKAVIDLINAPDRLRNPLKKTGDDRWEAVSWDEALELSTQKMNEIKMKYGAEALAVHIGQAGVRKEFTLYASRFCNAYGTPNFSTAGSHCHASKMMANMLTYGVLPVPDFEHSRCIVLWGSNPAKSCPPLMTFINKTRSKGAGLIVVDPRSNSQAGKADLHLQVRPGSDGTLALGMLNVIIREKLYDKDFVEKWTIGFEQLAGLVVEYPPEKVEEITWVAAEKIIEAARLYAMNAPACISAGIALELQTNGVQTVRAISILQAITGNLDISGGALFVPPARLSELRLEIEHEKPAIGQKEFPLFHRYTGNAQANIYADSILEGKPYPLKGMIVAGSNPVLTWPNATKVKKAFAGLDFLVVMDHFMTETARLADLVLPAAAFLERDELWHGAPVYGTPRIGFAPGVVRNESCLTDWCFWKELAMRMGYGEHFPWGSEEEALNFRLIPLNISVEELRRQPAGYAYAARVEKKYEKDGFRTRSGKVELYSEVMQEYGYDPLPVFIEPGESHRSTPKIAEEYPLVLSTGARSLWYMHSRFHNLPSLKKMSPEPFVEVHRDKAKELGLEEGETVVVESARGSIEVKVKITVDTDPRVLFIPHGWDEANANLLTGNEALDPISGFPPDRSLLARIIKKSE